MISKAHTSSRNRRSEVPRRIRVRRYKWYACSAVRAAAAAACLLGERRAVRLAELAWMGAASQKMLEVREARVGWPPAHPRVPPKT